MPQIIPQGDIFERIGSQIGKGSGQQVERSMLSKGLEKLAGNKDLSEIQRYAGLLKLPGGAEHAGTLIPALQRAAYGDVIKQRAQGASGVEPTAPQRETVAAPAPISSKKGAASGFASPEEIKASKSKLIQTPTPEAIAQGAIKYIQTGLDPVAAESKAALDIEQRRTEQKTADAELEQDLSKRMSRVLQGAGLTGDYKDVAGEIQDRILQEALHRRRSQGKTPEEVSDELLPIISDLGKAATQIQSVGDTFGLTDTKRRAFNQQKKIFDDYGFGEQFVDIAQRAAGITNIQAAMEFDPLKNDKAKKIIKSLPSHGAGLVNLNEKNLHALIESIQPEDNLLSIAGELRDKNYNVAQFLKAAGMKQNLEKRQERQLNKPASQSILGDILWKSF